MRIGSLFSGIGGLELGLERAGIGHTVWQVENNPALHPCLAEHWPHAKRFHDVREVGAANLDAVDIICGGFPCQDVSSAGKRVGLTGARSGLWYEFARVAEELRPKWIVVENVSSGANGWVDAVRGGLERLGYASLPVPLRASDLGACHLRARVFILACHADRDRESVDAEYAQVDRLPSDPRRFPDWTQQPDLRMDDGLSSGVGVLGNSVVPQCAEVIGWMIRELESQP